MRSEPSTPPGAAITGTYAEQTPEGECRLGGGELLGPGEVVLDPGQTRTAPWLVGSWSVGGLDGAAHRLHEWTRRHAARSHTPRPVVVNTWRRPTSTTTWTSCWLLADAAAGVGAEWFVLDDGWFRGRRGATAGLGDWTVDPDVGRWGWIR